MTDATETLRRICHDVAEVTWDMAAQGATREQCVAGAERLAADLAKKMRP